MLNASAAEHFFETDADQQKRQRRSAKSSNTHGHPVRLQAKALAVLADPSSPSHVFVADAVGTVRRIHVDASSPSEAYAGPQAPVTSLALGEGEKGEKGESKEKKRTLFAGCWDKSVWSWDVATHQPGRRYVGHTDFVKTVACARLGGRAVLVSGSADKTMIVWDVATGQRLHTLRDRASAGERGRMLAVQHVAVDPATTADELWLVSASSDPLVRQWRVRADGWEMVSQQESASTSTSASASTPASTSTHETTVYKVLFEGDDDDEKDFLWTCSADGTAKCLVRRRGFADGPDTVPHGDHVRALAVTEAWVVTGGRDEDVQFWDRAMGRRYATLSGHFDEVTDMAVLADGRRVCSVSLDGTVRTWPLDRAGLDALVAQQEAEEERRKKGGGEEEETVQTETGLTAEEEAELAAMMEE